ncbi:MAG: enoyl-CoA hydratase/isomerase family protein [Candidatus Xenobia bacterium]
MDLVQLAIEGPVATLTLNRPNKLNALDWDMREGLFAAVQEAEDNATVRVLIITGAGSAFCAGCDVESMGDHLDHDRLDELRAMVRTGARFVKHLRGSRLPVIAAINGMAAGAGLGIALACDFRIAAEGARLGQINGRMGLPPDWGTAFHLPRLIGPAAALRLFITTQMLEVEEAWRIGLVDEVVPPEELYAATMELADTISKGAPQAVARMKQFVYRSLETDLAAMLDLEEDAAVKAFMSEDVKEGLRAIRERRQPDFAGR